MITITSFIKSVNKDGSADDGTALLSYGGF